MVDSYFLIAIETHSQYVGIVEKIMEAPTDSVRAETWLPLPKAGKGQRVRVQKLEGHESVCNRLREMGFCEESEVKILNNSGALLCQVCGSKVCLSHQIADSILVAPTAP